MSVTLKLMHKNSGEIRDVRFEFSFLRFNGLPIELQDITSGTHFYYPSFEKIAKEWEFPPEGEK